MAIDPATGEEEEDLWKIEWGAGLGRMISGQVPNFLLVLTGVSCFALPSYLVSGSGESFLSKGSDINFPIVLSSALLVLCTVLVAHLNIRRKRAVAEEAERKAGILHDPMMTPSAEDLMALVDTTWGADPRHAKLLGLDQTWPGILGFSLYSSGLQRKVEMAALL